MKNGKKRVSSPVDATLAKVHGSLVDLDRDEPSGTVPVVIRRLRLPALPVGSMFCWYNERLENHRWQLMESRRRVKHLDAARRHRKAQAMKRYRAKLRAARPDLKAIWRARRQG